MKGKGKGSWFKQYQGGHYTGNQKCGQEHFSTGSAHKPGATIRSDKQKTSSKGKSKSY